MDVGKAFGYVFEDERWATKLITTAAIALIPVFGTLSLMGYVISTIRNVMAGHPRPLPEWQDLGTYFMDGLKMFVVNLVYNLPLTLLSWLIVFPIILPFLGGQNEDLMTALGIVAIVLIILISIVLMLAWLLMIILLPMAQIVFAARGEIGAALRVGEVLRLAFANIGQILIAQLLIVVAGATIMGLLSLIISVFSLIPICGWILAVALAVLMLPVGTWLALFAAHLYGQIGARAGLSYQ